MSWKQVVGALMLGCLISAFLAVAAYINGMFVTLGIVAVEALILGWIIVSVHLLNSKG